MDRFIYFIQGEDTKRIKIGRTEDVDARKAHLLSEGATEHLTILHRIQYEVETTKEINSIETQFHEKFEDDHFQREIFEPENIEKFLKRLEDLDNPTPDDIMEL